MQKTRITLIRPRPASNDCLPHAAMNLGSGRGTGTRPVAGMVYQLIIQEQMGQWCMFRMDDAGGFVGDTWHPTCEDAIDTARKEFGADNVPHDFKPQSDSVPNAELNPT